MLSRRVAKNFFLWHTTNFHYVSQLVCLILPWEQWVTCIQLSQYAAKTPHVYRHSERNPEDDFWSPVESRLDVSVDSLANEAGAPVVDDLDATLVLLFKQNVFWF